MKNVALAAINFHDQLKHFPISEDYYNGATVMRVNVNALTSEYTNRGEFYLPPDGLDGGGWLVRVLPFLEEQALYDQFDLPDNGLGGRWASRFTGMNWNDPEFRLAVATQPAIFVCPSNELTGPRDDQYPYSASGQIIGFPVSAAITCYKGNAGDAAFEPEPVQQPVGPNPQGYWTYNPLFKCYIGNDCVGLFWRTTYIRKGVKLREITDGTSKTFLIGEALPEDGNSAAWSSDGDWAMTGVQLNWDWRTAGECIGQDGEPNRGFAFLLASGVRFPQLASRWRPVRHGRWFGAGSSATASSI